MIRVLSLNFFFQFPSFFIRWGQFAVGFDETV